ncbi:MAG TPA: hypothetical protein VER55_08680, partial [Ardenticatenaceae bacterium]|nr:hypothetical protein [Ardenticatenaceae bacterium]
MLASPLHVPAQFQRAARVLLAVILIASALPITLLFPPPTPAPLESLAPQRNAPALPQLNESTTSTAAPTLQSLTLSEAKGLISTLHSPLSTHHSSLIAHHSSWRSSHVADLDLGDGRRMAVVYPAPVAYQDEEGNWQPIEARFERVPGGYANRRNTLQIAAGERRASLRLRHGDHLIAWEPRAVVVTRGEGRPAVLAEPLDSQQAGPAALTGKGGALRYEKSWSLAGLAEEIVAGPGQVEQSLVFAERPRGDGETLVFQAALVLPPGAGLYINGTRQTGPFTTGGEIEVRATEGQSMVVLHRPRAFEQGDPSASVAARYRLSPEGAGRWALAVETPWSWWADPARVYPAVLDPTIGVLQPTTAYQVPPEIHGEGANCGRPPHPNDPYQGATPDVCDNGIEDCGAVVIFNELPTLPPNAKVSAAKLAVAAVRGDYLPSEGDQTNLQTAWADVYVRPITNRYASCATCYTVGDPVDGLKRLEVAPPPYND